MDTPDNAQTHPARQHTGHQHPGHQPLHDEPEQWPVTRHETPFDGAIFGINTDTLTTPDGDTAVRDYLRHPGAVAVVVVNDRDEVLLQSQYRHPVSHRLWELPAGLLDADGEDPWAAARRELYEEAHLAAGDWRVLTDVFTTPGSSQETMRIYLARDVRPAEGEQYERTAEEAGLVPAWSPLPDLVEGVLTGRLHNPSAVTGILALHAAHTTGTLDQLRPADAPWPEHTALHPTGDTTH